ncbi:MAG: DUF2807 domain-containing protein [Chthoniobacterales bacterium]|nr:DUF2807 domain-containing protein [Chthoniobacterales bacterium]
MKTKTLFPTLVLTLLFAGCDWHHVRGNGETKTETRPVSAFTQIEASGYYELEWSPGNPSLSITTDENLLSHISTSVQGSQLKIDIDGPIAPSHGITIIVSSPSLTTAELSGAVDFTAKPINGAKFSLETSGAAKVNLGGKVSRLLANLTGACKLEAADLSTDDVELSVTGAGRADVTVANSLRAAITGAGKVTYGGNPKTVDRNVMGAGKIEPRD